MAHAVVFRLEAAIAAFGEVAVGERRGSRRRPTTSAILGLVASALGIGREADGHAELARDWRIALRCDRLGAPLADFHTAQTPPQRRNRRFATRREELADKLDLGTVISRRDHFTDAAFTIVLWPADGLGSKEAAERVAEALARPRWSPFVGRRACPPSRPFAPLLVDPATVAAAFDAFDAAERAAHDRAAAADEWLPPPPIGRDHALDDDFRAAPLGPALEGFELITRETVRDAIVDRARRLFRPRDEWIARRIQPQEATS